MVHGDAETLRHHAERWIQNLFKEEAWRHLIQVVLDLTALLKKTRWQAGLTAERQGRTYKAGQGCGGPKFRNMIAKSVRH